MNDPNNPTKGNAPRNPQADAPMARNNVPNQHPESMAHRVPANPYADRRRMPQLHGQPSRVASNNNRFEINRFATNADIPGNHGGPIRQRTANFAVPIHENAGLPAFCSPFGPIYQPSHAAPPGFPVPPPNFHVFLLQPAPLIHPDPLQGAHTNGFLAVMGNQPRNPQYMLPTQAIASRSPEATLRFNQPSSSFMPVRQPGLFDAGTSAPPDSSQSAPSNSSSSGFSDQPISTPAPVGLQATPEIVAILQEFESPSPAQFVLGMGNGVRRSREEVRELREAIARLQQERQIALDAQLAAEQRWTTANEQHEQTIRNLTTTHQTELQYQIDRRTESETALQAANDSARQVQENADRTLQELMRERADLGRQVTTSRDEARQAQETAAALSGQLRNVRNDLESAGRRTNIAIQSRNDAIGQVANLERQLLLVRADFERHVATASSRAPETSARPEQAEFGQSLADREVQHEVDKINAVHDSMEDQPGPSEMPAWSGEP